MRNAILFYLLSLTMAVGCHRFAIPPKQAKFLDKYSRTAMDLGKTYGISPSVILACAMVTSHSDTFPPGNSFFQLPAVYEDKAVVTYRNRAYKAYANFYESVVDACRTAKSSKETSDEEFVTMCALAQQDCECSKYIEIVHHTAEAYGLDTFD